MSIMNIITLLGGLGLFLFGMKVMGDAIGRQAGGQFKDRLEHITSSTVKGVLLGTALTAIIQSSSATIVMVMGFVNTGIMTIQNSVGLIMGANIGTTATAWILSLNSINGSSFILQLLNPDTFVPILAFLGACLVLFSQKSRRNDIGLIMLGFAVLMFGMDTMSGAMAPLSQDEKFRNLLLLFNNPILGVLIGFVMTAIIQSSSASVGILQAMSVTGSITYGNAIPIIMGQNIGACVVVLLSSVGTNREAKRVAWIHLYFNIIGTVIFLLLFYIANAIFQFTWINYAVNYVTIAVIHTTFKLASTIVLIPFTKQLIHLAEITIPSAKEDEKFHMLDDHFLKTPSVAVALCDELTAEMAETAREAIHTAVGAIHNYNEADAKIVTTDERTLDRYEDKLGTYMVKLSAYQLTDKDTKQLSKFLHCIGDLERLGDHAENLLETSEEIFTKKIVFSKEAQKDLAVMYKAVGEITDISIDCLKNNDISLAQQVEPLEEVIDELKNEIRAKHVERLQRGVCTPMHGFVLNDIINNLERISDHCSNLAVCVIQVNINAYNTHKYLRTLKNSNNEKYMHLYDEYAQRYMLD